MPYKFPSFDHVPLVKPPLREVICQIQFPPILRIGEKRPADFQDRIRGRFPQFETSQTFTIDAVGEFNGKTSSPTIAPTVYRFIDTTDNTSISLGINFVAFSVSKYEGWDWFADGLKFTIDTIEEIYRPNSASRVGLRYINFLNSQTTGMNDFKEILGMVRPELTAAYTMDEFSINEGLTRLISENNDERLSLICGLVNEEKNMLSFAIDLDMYIEKSMPFDTERLMSICDNFHAALYNAFRWSLADSSFLQNFIPKG